jgi:hypothetical protein
MSERTAFDRAQALNSYPDGIERNFWHQARGRIVTRLCEVYRAEPLLEIDADRGRNTEYPSLAGLKALLYQGMAQYFVWESGVRPRRVPGSSLLCIAKPA